jgi:hypothetical protein
VGGREFRAGQLERDRERDRERREREREREGGKKEEGQCSLINNVHLPVRDLSAV